MTKMPRPAIITSVLGLLLFCSTVHGRGSCPGSDVAVKGEGFHSLNSTFLEKFGTLLDEDLTVTNAKADRLRAKLSGCLQDIRAAREACAQCINSECQLRAIELGCGRVDSTDVNTVYFIGAIATSIVLDEAHRLVGDHVDKAIKHVATKVISGFHKAAKAAAKVAQKVIGGVKKTVQKVGKVVKKVGSFVKKTVKKIFKGWRRRRETEPASCPDMGRDGACEYYASRCPVCYPFNVGGLDPTPGEIIENVCNPEAKRDYGELEEALARVENIREVITNFTLLAVSYQVAGYRSTEKGANSCVKVTFSMIIEERTYLVKAPVKLFDAETAGPILAKEIYELLVPF